MASGRKIFTITISLACAAVAIGTGIISFLESPKVATRVSDERKIFVTRFFNDRKETAYLLDEPKWQLARRYRSPPKADTLRVVASLDGTGRAQQPTSSRPVLANPAAASKADVGSDYSNRIPTERIVGNNNVVQQQKRVALVIGNSAYQNVARLSNPSQDSVRVADAFRSVGFQNVILLNDLTRDKMFVALRDFAQVAAGADWAVVYFAGHGVEVGGTNYLLPTDARLKVDADVSLEAVSLEQVINAAERASKLRLIVLDACRDNPFANQMKQTMAKATRSVSRGLAQVEPTAGTMVAYAAKHGQTALDGDGTNSPFAAAFVKNIRTPGLEVRRLFDYVRDDVMESTKDRQQPFSYGSISGRQDFYFVAKN